jgi:hypothetical protein
MTLETPHSPYLEAVGHDLLVAARRQAHTRRRRRAQLRLAVLSLAALVLLAGTAVAGRSILGARASGLAQTAVDSLWKGGDRSALAPLPGNARAVARVGATVLYRSRSTDPGSVCLAMISSDLVVPKQDRTQTCIGRDASRAWPTGVTVHPFGGRLAFFGQVRLPPGGRLVLERAGGDPVPVALGVDGWFLGLLSLARAAPRALPPLEGTLRILDSAGGIVASAEIRGFPTS